MADTKQKIVRYVVDLEAVRNLDDQALAANNQDEGYTPVLQTPNFFRKLYGYTVYQKDAKSAF